MKFVICLLCLVFISNIQAIDVTGFVRDSRTEEPLAGAWIRTANRSIETASDQHGRYLLRNVPDSSIILTSFMGYMPDTTCVHSTSDTLHRTIFLSIGPSFENSPLHRDYHARLSTAWQKNPDLIVVRINKIKRVNNLFVVTLECRNNYDESIWLPVCRKYGGGLELQLTTKENEKILPTLLSHGSPGDSYVAETEVIEIKPHHKKKLPPMTLPYEIDSLIKYHGRIAIDIQAIYEFDIAAPLLGYWYDKDNPNTPPLSAIEQTHTKLLRLPFKSEKKTIKL